MSRGGVSGDFLEELKSKIDIVDVASRYMTMTRRGANYWACCPFHMEKTPSFSIKQDSQFYKCFGCGESGDVISLVMKIENVDFMTAVEMLCKIAGMEMPSEQNNAEMAKRKFLRDNAYHVLKLTADFYHNNLLKNPNTEQAKYLSKRNISPEMIEKFNIGASLNYDELPRYLKKMGVSDENMLLAGVVARSEYGKLYDFYGARLIFPILNGFGDTIGFSGRSVEDSPQHTKYKNTPQSVVFNKSEVLFAYNFVRDLKKDKLLDTIILVEGHVDVIACHQVGITNTIGSMGTALTSQHARKIKQLVENVILCFDGDDAGAHATYKAIDTLKDVGLNVKVVRLTGAKDPDEYIKKFGKDAFMDVLTKAVDCVDFILTDSVKKYNLNNNAEKNKYIGEALNYISKFSTPAEQEIYLSVVQKLTRVPIDALRKSLHINDEKKEVPAEENVSEMSSNNYITESKIMLLASMLYKKIKNFDEISGIFAGDDELSELYRFMANRISENKDFIVSTLFDNFDIDKKSLIDKVINYVFPPDDVYPNFLRDTIKRVKLYQLQQEKDKYTRLMESSMTDADRMANLIKVQELTKKINEEKK